MSTSRSTAAAAERTAPAKRHAAGRDRHRGRADGLGCAGACAGVLYLATSPRSRGSGSRPDIEVPGITVQPPDVNDWMTTRTLSQVYTSSLAAVVANKAVIERLGEPVLTDLEAEELYRRKPGDGGASKLSLILKGRREPASSPWKAPAPQVSPSSPSPWRTARLSTSLRPHPSRSSCGKSLFSLQTYSTLE